MSLSDIAAERFKGPVVIYQKTLSDWCRDAVQMSSRKVELIELCSAKTSASPQGIYDHRRHTFLRAYMEPTAYRPQEVILLERIRPFKATSMNSNTQTIYTSYHSVVPLRISFREGKDGRVQDTDPVDIVSTIPRGSVNDLVRKSEIERSFLFRDRMTLPELAAIFALVGGTTLFAWSGARCEDLSRLFAFTCLAALVPTLPPSMKEYTGSAKVTERDSQEVFFDDEARHFLEQLSWMAKGTESDAALKLIREKRQGK